MLLRRCARPSRQVRRVLDVSSSVAVITDSTAYLPSRWTKEHHVVVVPVQVIVAGTPMDETDSDQAALVTQALARMEPVTTSRPSPTRFIAALQQAQSAGARQAVIATLSSAMSATYESAVLAAGEVDLDVEVIDSRTIAMGLGYGVIDGAQEAALGKGLAEVSAAIRATCQRSQVLFYVDTMEYLRRGGRVSASRAAVGQVMHVKPILHVVDGQVQAMDRVRTSGKAIARLLELTVEAVAGRRCRIAVQHLAAAERAADLAQRIGLALPDCTLMIGQIGGVIGAHVGPGMVAVVVSPQ